MSTKAKHRSICKCTAGFVHHCQWLKTASRAGITGGSSALWPLPGLLCLVIILLYILIQYINLWVLQWKCWQAEHVAVVPAIFSPQGQDCSANDNQGVSAGVGVICLLLIECLFIFHLYLMLNRMRTFDCVTWGHEQQRSRASSRNKNRTLRI